MIDIYGLDLTCFELDWIFYLKYDIRYYFFEPFSSSSSAYSDNSTLAIHNPHLLHNFPRTITPNSHIVICYTLCSARLQSCISSMLWSELIKSHPDDCFSSSLRMQIAGCVLCLPFILIWISNELWGMNFCSYWCFFFSIGFGHSRSILFKRWPLASSTASDFRYRNHCYCYPLVSSFTLSQ